MRIIIVEDEVKIREGMGKLIESQTEHLVIGEASNGQEGMELILRFKPDLVITDIRMPKLDGLEMLRILREEYKTHFHCVILSGYSEFDYAKKAIQYGADDYLLKPLIPEDVVKMLEKIQEKIETELLLNGTTENHLKNLIMEGEEQVGKNLKILEEICGFEKSGTYEIFMGYIGSAPTSYRDTMQETITEILEKYHRMKISGVYLENKQLVCFLAQENDKDKQLEQLEKSIYNRMIVQYMNKEEKPVWTKKICEGLEELKATIEKLQLLLSDALIYDIRGWLTEAEEETYQVEIFSHPIEINNRLRNGICKGNQEEIKDSAEAFLSYMREHHFTSEDVRRAFQKSYYLMGDAIHDIDPKLYQQLNSGNLLRNLELAMTRGELERAYRDIIHIFTGNRTKREDISNYVIKKAINYIREHYQEGLTQEEISRELDITPEYLSTLFNREMGITFSAFLKQFRISHAKRLLKGTNHKIYEIADEIGYGDSKYFQRVFKEEVGISPGEYRQLNQEGLHI